MSYTEYTKEDKALFLSGINDERKRIISLIAADCNHAEPWCYHRDVIKLIRGEDND